MKLASAGKEVKKKTMKKSTKKKITKNIQTNPISETTLLKTKIAILSGRVNELEKNLHGLAIFLSKKQLKSLMSWVNQQINLCNTKHAWGKQYAYKEVLLQIQKQMMDENNVEDKELSQ